MRVTAPVFRAVPDPARRLALALSSALIPVLAPVWMAPVWMALLPMALLPMVLAAPASSELRLCNQTPEAVTVAVGYRRDGAWVSEGWWAMGPGDCKVAIGGDLANRVYYYRATSHARHFPGESFYFCTAPGPFEIIGDHECEARGHRRAEFAALEVGDAVSFTLTLSPAPVPAPPALLPGAGTPAARNGAGIPPARVFAQGGAAAAGTHP